ncbi:MAG: ABC transporter ATP-binding protein [Alicyclobacillus sp.]|nr:ABC transporter ATP-binding protein [Alicyclobacillus sp.]
MSLVSVEHLNYRYHPRARRNVLNDINLSIGSNEIYGLVGESGCGKSTLGKIIAGVVKAEDGVVRFEDKNIQTLKGNDFRRYRRGIQMVHQDPYASLNPSITIYETLSAGMLAHKLVSRRDAPTRVKELLDAVGLDASDDFLHRYPHQLSGGQRQRVGIARALAVDPKFMIADESVSMLDVSMRISVLDVMLKLKEEKGLSYLFITHDFGVISYFAEGYRIGVLYYGVLVEEGICAEVIRTPLHPYTYTLLSAVPIPDPKMTRRRTRIELRNIDDVEAPSTGCCFANRCPFATARCSEETPRLTEVAPGHKTACFYPEKIPHGW